MAKNKEKIMVELTIKEIIAIASALMLEQKTLQFLRGWGEATEREKELCGLADRLICVIQKSDFNTVCR